MKLTVELDTSNPYQALQELASLVDLVELDRSERWLMLMAMHFDEDVSVSDVLRLGKDGMARLHQLVEWSVNEAIPKQRQTA